MLRKLLRSLTEADRLSVSPRRLCARDLPLARASHFNDVAIHCLNLGRCFTLHGVAEAFKVTVDAVISGSRRLIGERHDAGHGVI